MKTGRIFWGIILVYLGGVFLLENFNIIDFSWRAFFKLWPILLILLGVRMLLAGDARRNVIAVGLITLLGLGLFTFWGVRESRNQQDDWIFSFKRGGERHNDLKTITSYYSEDYNDKIQVAALEIKGGAGDFELKSTSDKLFEAKVESGDVNYVLRRSDRDSLVKLDFGHKEKNNVVFPTDRFHSTKIFLNANPFWDIELKVGAADVDFDLSHIKVRKLNLAGGAADLEVRLGDLVEKVDVKAETGVSSVKIEVPRHVGCRIINKSGLSSKNFNEFVETEKGVYESKNFNSATKHIYIELKSGISDLNVEAY